MIYQLLSNGDSGSSRSQDRARGQSLVEFAIVLPILLLVVAGTLEVGNVLTIFNRVQTAAREGARFAAAGGSDVKSIVDQASRESLEMDEDFMTVWVIRPTVNAQDAGGNALPFDQWTWVDGSRTDWGVPEQCIFGDFCGTPSPVTPEKVLGELNNVVTTDLSAASNIDDTTFAVVVIRYEVDTILNLPFWQAGDTTAQGRVPIWSYGIMVQEVEDQTVEMLANGCSAYPLALNRDIFGANPREGELFDAEINLDNNHGLKLDGLGLIAWNGDTWDNHNGGLTSNINASCPGAITTSAVSLDPICGYNEYDDPGDTSLHRGDWVLNIPKMNSPISVIQEDLEDYYDIGQQLRVIVYELDYDAGTSTWNNPRSINDGNPSDEKWLYQVSEFAIVRVANVYKNGPKDGQFVQFEFVRWDTSCGFDPGS